MTLELLRPWGCEVAPGEMPVVCASLVLEQCPQRTQGTMVDLGVTHVCEWLLVLSCLHMDFHTCAATCTFEEAQGLPWGHTPQRLVSGTQGDRNSRLRAPQRADSDPWGHSELPGDSP